ncbi:MAG: DUF4270 domain-containing protein [Tannerellaceae bacterium]
MQPYFYKITVYMDRFQLTATTIMLDTIYAKTITALLGEIYDPLYGNLKSDYICQFYCPDNYQFAHKPIDGKIDSVEFKILYTTAQSIGDSLAPMRAQIYQVTTPLDKNYYTNIDPKKFCNMQIPLGSQTYTQYDQSIPDSIRKLPSNSPNAYFPNVTIRMPKELGQKFYNETINNPGTFKNQETFNQFFPGLYVTNTFGSGNILSIDNSSFTIFYKFLDSKKDVNGKDSTFVAKASERFTVTKEVIQLNRFKNTDMSQLLKPNDDFTYLKTPAGVYTRIVIPAKKIIPIIKDRIINNLAITLKAMPQEEWKYALAPPANLLLLPEDSVKAFFEDNRIENGQTVFLSDTYSFTTRSYYFNNISNILKEQIKNAPDKDLVLLVVPVNRVAGQSNSYGNTQSYTVALHNYLAPSGVKLRKDSEAMQIQITTSKFR